MGETPTDNLEILKSILLKHFYILGKKIGSGGFGNVYLVHSMKYDKDFVLKQLKLERCRQGAIKEVDSMVALCHPNIISIYDTFSENHQLYLILEYCPHGTLQELVSKDGPIQPPLLYKYCHQILEAVAHCHSNHIAHRDIKPANILLDRYYRIKLSDFGLSKEATPGELIHEFSGTSMYMAPEVHKHKDYDPFKADIWALGITFYVLASGNLPWSVKSPEQIKHMIFMGVIENSSLIQPQFMKIIRKMIDVNPSSRPSIQKLLNCSLIRGTEIPKQITQPVSRIYSRRLIKAKTFDRRTFGELIVQPSIIPSPTFIISQ